MIDPRTAREGEDYLAYNRRRWGGDGWTADLRRSAKKDGNLEFRTWRYWPHTLDALRLVHLMKKKFDDPNRLRGFPSNKQGEAKDILFRLCYEEGKNVSQLDVLVEAAVELSLDRDEAIRYFKSNEDVAEVKRLDGQAKSEYDIHGVPYFIFRLGQTAFALEGAQSTATFSKVLLKLIEKEGY
jgi:predicted DsbA family dithiol-disulfide isomerase